jgi:hypothetical protein
MGNNCPDAFRGILAPKKANGLALHGTRKGLKRKYFLPTWVGKKIGAESPVRAPQAHGCAQKTGMP